MLNHCCAGLSRGVPSRSGRSKNDTSLVTICTSASDRRCDGLGHSGEIISGLEIISSTRAAGARLGPAQSPRPIQHTHDTITRRGRAHVPARPVGDASLCLSRTPLPSYSVPRPAAGGRSSLLRRFSEYGNKSLYPRASEYHAPFQLLPSRDKCYDEPLYSSRHNIRD